MEELRIITFIINIALFYTLCIASNDLIKYKDKNSDVDILIKKYGYNIKKFTIWLGLNDDVKQKIEHTIKLKNRYTLLSFLLVFFLIFWNAINYYIINR